MELTDRQARMHEFVRRYVDENGYPPSIRDIQYGLRISSTSVVSYHLNALEKAGLLCRAPGRARAMVLQSQPHSGRRGAHAK